MNKQKTQPGTRKIVLFIVLVFFLGLVLVAQQRTKNNYSLVIIVADALRADILGCSGGPAKTPNIDWLAKQGTQYMHAYAAGAYTEAAAVALFTGQYYINNPVVLLSKANKTLTWIPDKYQKIYPLSQSNYQGYEFVVPKKEKTMPVILKDKGYFFDFYSENPRPLANGSLGKRGYKEKQWSDFNLALKNMSHIKGAMLYWLITAHSPYKASDKQIACLSEKERSIAKKYRQVLSQQQLFEISKNPNKNILKKLYIMRAETLDLQIGQIISELKESNKYKDTYIVFVADHGEAFGEHTEDFFHGGTAYQEKIHIPLIIVGPNLPQHKKIQGNVSQYDVLPTVEALLNIKEQQGPGFNIDPRDKALEKNLKNRDLILPLFSFMLTETSSEIGSVQLCFFTKQNNEYKFLRNHSNPDASLLFNLTKDPEEKDNIIDSNPALIKHYAKIIDKELGRIEYNNKALLQKEKHMSTKEYQEKIEALRAIGYMI